MGEVRVRVKLTNTTDLGLVRRNLMQPGEVRSVEVDALVDTGAVLEKMDLHVDRRERRLLPNPAHPDQPVLKVKRRM